MKILDEQKFTILNFSSSSDMNKQVESKILDFSGSTTLQKKAVVYGCLIGDSLGATSEFKIPNTVGKLMVKGWPSTYIGSGLWKPGEPTDDSDMAMCILRNVLNNFIQWYRNGPKDIGFTTVRTLSSAEKNRNNGKEWYLSGLEDFDNHPTSAPNGSLMRNAIIPVITLELDVMDAIDQTVEQSMMTHFGPLPVLTCIVHTILIRKALKNEEIRKNPPNFSDIVDILSNEWKEWKNEVKFRKEDNPSKIWLNKVGSENLNKSETQFIDEIKDFENFDPYTYYYKGVSGYCVLSLKIALWSLYHSFDELKLKIPDWFESEWPFKKFNFESIMWVVLIGADADTYGAIAGPLLAAYHPKLPEVLVEKLQLHEEIETIFKSF
eukprot:gene2212-2386_t